MADFDIDKLKKEQIRLAKKVIPRDKYEKIVKVAGFGRAFINNKMVVTVVVMDFKTCKVIETQYLISDLKFPFISGLMSYRESRAFVDAYNKLENEPDILLIPAHGLLHPRKLGMASHLGLLLDKPTIGISKHLICGKVEKGKVYLENELLGTQLTTKEHSNPVYVSIGHKVSLGTAMKISKNLIKKHHKMPEPLHEANKIAKRIKRQND